MAASAAPWRQPLSFRPLAGWRTGASGTVHEFRDASGKRYPLKYPESAAWISEVPYRDFATTDPPQRTVRRMARTGVVVWAVITPLLALDSRKPIALRLSRFHHGLCCDGTAPPYMRVWDSAGRAPAGRYELSVRIYFGSVPTDTMRREARRALGALSLPRGRG